MSRFFYRLSRTLRNSITLALAIITATSTITGIIGFSIRDIDSQMTWWGSLLILLGLYALLVAVIYAILKGIQKRPIRFLINGNRGEIRIGNIFSTDGMRVIPFNEFYDTKVDDVVISKKSLNGVFITRYVKDIEQLKEQIRTADSESSNLKSEEVNGRKKYPLGRIIAYDEYLLLAFSHFNENNEAHIDIADYERCLFQMWREIRRTYSGKDVVLPLIGSGITTFDGVLKKDNTDLLKCLLCTLRASGVQLNSKISIVLTDEVFNSINIDSIREELKQ